LSRPLWQSLSSIVTPLLAGYGARIPDGPSEGDPLAAKDVEPPREVCVAPVTITPTKPLTPTHVKGLLWTDVLVKATALTTPVRLVWNPRLAHLTTQTLAFWQHLDATEPDVDWNAMSEADIGERYVRFHAGPPTAAPRALGDYFERVDRDGWVHPAGLRMLELWRAEFEHLHVADPGLTTDRPLAMGLEEVVAELAAAKLVIDHRRYGGPVYLEGARWGMPVRGLTGAHGHPNYLMAILREVVPLAAPDRLIVLIYDEGLHADYLLLDRTLTTLGARVERLPLSRVAIDGTVRSSRHGGWTGCTLADLASVEGSAAAVAYRLGMRLYFVGVLDRGSPQSFSMKLLRRCVGRAGRYRGDRLAPLPTHPSGYVDPHRLTTSLMGRRPAPARPEVFG
jgi:hypothetical protein